MAAEPEGVVATEDDDSGDGQDDDDEERDRHRGGPGGGVLAKMLCRSGLQSDVPSGAVIVEGGLVARVGLECLFLGVHGLANSLIKKANSLIKKADGELEYSLIGVG